MVKFRVTRLWLWLRLFFLLIFLLLILREPLPDLSRRGLIKAQVHGQEFNYIAWELDALWQKFKQAFLGFQPYISDEDGKQVVLEYVQTVGQTLELESQIEAIYADPSIANPDDAAHELQRQHARLMERLRELQPFAEPIIERQVATILQEEGFGTMGQMLPPVSFRFVEPPDVLIVSPRHTIQQDFNISLKPSTIQQRAAIEARVEAVSPSDAAYVTGVGGVGIWPSMVIRTRWTAIVFEIVAHEWSHHYLFAYPSGMEYLMRPETRSINETTATVFGNAVGLKVLERFYADEVAMGLIRVPRYPTLADFQRTVLDDQQLGDPDAVPDYDQVRSAADFLLSVDRTAAAQRLLDTYRPTELVYDGDLLSADERSVEINRTRITTDFLLSLGRVEAAEAFMESRRQLLGMRVLNQAWFAFNGGYQADPASGGGVALGPIVDVTDPRYVGDPIGPAIHELMVLAPDLQSFLVAVRGVTTRDELITALIEARERWG